MRTGRGVGERSRFLRFVERDLVRFRSFPLSADRCLFDLSSASRSLLRRDRSFERDRALEPLRVSELLTGLLLRVLVLRFAARRSLSLSLSLSLLDEDDELELDDDELDELDRDPELRDDELLDELQMKQLSIMIYKHQH